MYTDPSALGPRQWFAASNVYSGQHGKIRRCRWANLVTDATEGYDNQQDTNHSGMFTGLYNFRDLTQSLLLGDVNNKLFSFDSAFSYLATQRFNAYFDPLGAGVGQMQGPWSRTTMLNLLFEMNGVVKQTGRGANAAFIEDWGLDSPDVAPEVSLAPAGAITKSVGVSYAVAWENVNKNHVGPPSPATAYVAYTAQHGFLELVQPGTLFLDVPNTNTVKGTGTAFSPAWVGKRLWIEGMGGSTNPPSDDPENTGPESDFGAGRPRVVAVNSPTELIIDGPITFPTGITAPRFQIFDPQATHLRLYRTADAGSVYLRTQRNVFDASQSNIILAGLTFADNDNSEPPNGDFTTEQAQFFNVPPPIGKFVVEYQSRLVIFGVPGAEQTLFYTNIELTSVGNPPESMAPLNQITLPIRDGEIRGVAKMPTGLIVWSDKQDMYKISGQLVDNSVLGAVQQGASVQALPYNLGCLSPFAVVSTSLGVFWLTADKEVWLYTDAHAPRNVGRPVQDILSAINPDTLNLNRARMAYVHADDRNWLALAIATGDALFNNTLLVLDLDMLASNGAPSSFIFDMATNQPSWYVLDIMCPAIASLFDSFGYQHLVAGGQDQIIDVTYKDGFFKIGDELPVAGSVTLHALGNETADKMKQLQMVRFITSTAPKDLKALGWSFRVDAIDDDRYTFDDPFRLDLLPEVNSPSVGHLAGLPAGSAAGTWPGSSVTRSGQFSPAMFRTVGIKSVQGRRLMFTVNFPTTPGEFELRSINLEAKVER